MPLPMTDAPSQVQGLGGRAFERWTAAETRDETLDDGLVTAETLDGGTGATETLVRCEDLVRRFSQM